jgi:dihydroflavonol-4-reductase
MSRPTTGCGRADPEEMYRSNVEGTRNVLAAARAGVERVVYTSTVGASESRKNGLGNEDTPVRWRHGRAYKRSKFLAEVVALEFAAPACPW